MLWKFCSVSCILLAIAIKNDLYTKSRMNEYLPNGTKLIHLNYEEVEVGKTAVKTIEIWNESCKEQMYQVQRDPTTNPLDHVFHLRSYTWILAPKEKYLCEIRYRPFVVSSKNVDYLTIIDSIGTRLKIVTRGSCIGPEVTCSTTKIVMISTNDNPEPKWRIKLRNNSKVAAIFMFAVDEKYRTIQLDMKHGCIDPCSYKYVTITFTPSEDGSHAYRLALLILHQEPIVIELYGYRNSSKNKVDASDFTYSQTEKNGFEGYMSDSVNATGVLPLISLSRNYFNFGQTNVEMEDDVQRIPHAICLTNHGPSDLWIAWEKDAIFSVTPCEMQVRANRSALFELSFNPNATNNLFGREIVASAFSEFKGRSRFPFITTVRAIGHSFPVGSNGWIPQYKIPETVIMPPCVPPFPVYTTFMIKKFGHLPLMFHFVPPPESHFTVKPMLGVIHQDYQIIAVQMLPKPEDEQIYIERWTIYFNGDTRNESCIDMKGYAEYANVQFFGKNELNFAPVIPRCQQFETLGMRNITRHTLKYTFYQTPPELTMQYESGNLDPNDTLFQECIFQPTELNVEYDFEIKCVLIVIKNGIGVGAKSCLTVRVRGNSKMGSLQAIPNELNFREVEYNATRTLSFGLFNRSPVNICYKLICTHRNWPLGDIETDVQLRPTSGTIFSGSHEQIVISITPRTPGYYELAVQYLVRVNSRSDILLTEQNPTRVSTAICMCILPILKVENMCAFGCEQKYSLNISKPFLWKSMQVEKLNEILKSILPGERKTLAIKFFPMVVNEGAFHIKLIMMNSSTLSVTWIFKWVQQCSCKPVAKKIGLSFQKEKLDCVHRTLCSVCPESGVLKPNKRTIITITVRYTSIGKSEISWDLDVGHDRHVTLNMLIDCLSESEQQHVFLNTTHVKFGRIYFGNKAAIHKTLWIRNVTSHDLPYFVNMDNICKLNEDYNCQIFACSPQNGTAEAYTSKCLLLKFQPRMSGAYKVVLPITLGNKNTELILEGESSCDFRSTIIGNTIPSNCACKGAVFPLYFSTDCIDMWSIPTHNFIVKMLLVYNNLPHDALAYTWKSETVPEILSVEVFPRKGIVCPNAVQSFKVKIRTNGHSCRVDVNIICEFFNAGKRRDYQRSVIKHNILKKELEGQFIITEKGITVPKPWIKILDKPEIFCKSLSLRCSIYPVEDECLRVSLADELKAAPSLAIFLNKSGSCKVTMEENELSITKFILEGLLWDIVTSKRFKRTVEESLIPRRNIYYSQMTMNLSDRKRLIRRSYVSPPLAFVNSILDKMLYVIVHEEFSLETAHLIPEEDVRHDNYIKTIPKQVKVHIEQGNNPLEKEEAHYRKMGSKVSFVD
ncbi:cilia- and flagella-associated protein 65 [Hylaeus volcanicus]|uniref:cilia- and flagella-associated protein 65 n=1 Tax=Hylaeus volcanicus TaxID=313075 RepID=UPI0023B78B19|nr:cilia- and flagella-associated protein 65 [Hylaeus volcanicus]